VSTLIANLDERVRKSALFRAHSVAEYFRNSSLRWWRPELSCFQNSYWEQENIIGRWLNKIRPLQPLELGPGFGRITHLLENYACGRLTLVEINKAACKKLAKEFPGERIINDDLTACRWDIYGPFDLIVAVEVLVHVQNIPALLSRICNALYPQKSAILSITPTEWYERYEIRRTIIHRGIDKREFEELALKFFQRKALHQTSNGQLLTYWFIKKETA